jgi:hypothetical protein
MSAIAPTTTGWRKNRDPRESRNGLCVFFSPLDPCSINSIVQVIGSIVAIIVLVVIGVAVGVTVAKNNKKSSNNSASSSSGAGSVVPQVSPRRYDVDHYFNELVKTNPNDPSTFVKNPQLQHSLYGIAYSPNGAIYPSMLISALRLLCQLMRL